MTRQQLEGLSSAPEIRWLHVGLKGSAPETQLIAVFEPRRAPGALYGMRWSLWPMLEHGVPAATDYADVGYDEFLADGIGSEARLGRLPAEPGKIRWLV